MDQEPRPRRTPPRKPPEIKVCGLQSCLALFERRSHDIIRVYLTEERIREFGHVLKFCAAQRRAYHVVTPADLEKVTESRHHEGVCILARQRNLETVSAFAARMKKSPGNRCVLALEDVANPHNVGAILRVASHFGVDAVLIFQEDVSEKIFSSAVYRTAEGGLEYLSVVGCANVDEGERELRKAGFSFVSTSSHAKTSLFSAALPERAVILMGSEALGLSLPLRKRAELDVAIPGAGHVESLNVACATAVCLGEHWRQHPRTPAPPPVARVFSAVTPASES